MTEVASASAKPPTLDDLMMAMDVVDTLRHRTDLVERELNEKGREAELIERLREIYRKQGIEVPDTVLAEGVKALEDSRFVYAPGAMDWRRRLFSWWVQRQRIGRYAALLLTAIFGLWLAYYVGVSRPARLAEERARIEIQETLPTALRRAHADIISTAKDATAKERADQLLADGERAIRDGDRATMQRIRSDLDALGADLNREYTLTIVSRPGETTGLWRRPPGGATARNYYLVVEAIAPDGSKLKMPVRNEETGTTETVDKFAVRVPQQVYDSVVQDKRDDGIVQRNRFAVKRRGTLAVDYQMPYEGGSITKW